MPTRRGPPDAARLDRIVADARRAREARDKTYREQALKLLPWICGRCTREFDRSNVHQLTVHHKDHNHDHNPADGSNWELLCVYCHDNEHSRELEAAAHDGPAGDKAAAAATHRPFADLADLLKRGGSRGA
jgi:5-methylcytosine-specific restriction endonuclease McrA